MILHCVSGDTGSDTLANCLAVLDAEDALLLLGDAIYAALSGANNIQVLFERGAQVYALRPDAIAAGIASRLDPRVQVIDFDGFVAVSEQCSRQQAWY